MTIIEQARPVATPIPGVAHATWAGSAQGLRQLSVWRQSIAAGAATPPHRHDCDEVVMCQEGWGEVHMGGAVHRFGPHQSVVLPAGQVHQIFNTGEVPMEIVGVFGQTPVACYLPDGQLLELPWAT